MLDYGIYLKFSRGRIMTKLNAKTEIIMKGGSGCLWQQEKYTASSSK